MATEHTNQPFLYRKAPESSSDDTRKYELAQLSNGLPVLAVHIPNTHQAAAALAIRAGHFQDPENTPGLAHFLEHMVFLGSEAFPEAESYSDFMSFAGGHHNAWTGTEHSNFYFELPVEHFAAGLNRFAALFSSPKFNQDWIDKERQAVEAEYRLKVKDELRRLYDVHKETSNPAHPFSRFSVGNASTLIDQPGASLRQQLFDFFHSYYHAGNMALVMTGPQSTEALLTLAAQHFTNIQAAAEATPAPTVPLYTPQQLAVRINVKPLKEANRLILTFALPGINHDYLHKTTSFIAHLLGYEGQHSLCAVLRAKGWITNLSAGGGASGSNFKDFNINLQLTKLGGQHEQEIISLCFAYIELIRQQGLQPTLYNERKQMVALAYQFPETVRPVDLASQLSVNLLHYEPQHVVSGDYRMDCLNTDFAHTLLAHLQPKYVRITRIHRSLPTNMKSKWYQADYQVAPLTAETLAEFNSESVRPLIASANLRLPPVNPYIPERRSPLPLASASEEYSAVPRYSRITPALELWHLQDQQFRVPKGHLYLQLRLPYANASARNYACSRIWCELGLELLNEMFYDAEVAGIHFNLYPQHGGITLHLAGFSCKQAQLFNDLVQTLGKFKPTLESFQQIRDQLRDNWHAVHKNNPINHLFAMLHHHLQQGAYTSKQLAESVNDLDYDHFINLLSGLFRDAQALMLVHGDWNFEQAESMAKHAAQHLPLVLKPSTKISRYVRRLPSGTEQHSFPSSHPDHATAFFIQGESTQLNDRACFLLLNHLANPHFFSELRTRQQLGYLVGTSYTPMHGLPGLLFYVQSPTAEPNTLSSAIANFIQNLAEELQSIDQESFSAAQQAVANHFFDPDPSLRISAQRNWQTITHNQGQFGLAKELGQAILNLELNTFLHCVKQHLSEHKAAMALHTSALTVPQ